MMRLLLMVLAAGLLHAADATAHTDADLGVVFPARLAAFSFVTVERYDDARLGYSLSYRGDGGEVADVYVYDGGLTGIGSGVGDPQVQSAFDGAMADIRQAQSLGYYLTVSEDQGRRERLNDATAGHWRCTSLAISVSPKLAAEGPMSEVRSQLLVSSLRGKLIKIRCTHPQSNAAGEEAATAFANAVATALALP